MPFGCLEFSRAIRGNHARTRSGSGSLPGPVLFEPGLTGMGYPLRHPDPNRISETADRKPPRTVGRFLSETNHCNGSDRTVATVRSGSDDFIPPGAL